MLRWNDKTTIRYEYTYDINTFDAYVMYSLNVIVNDSFLLFNHEMLYIIFIYLFEYID